MQELKDTFILNFIDDNRWRYIADGLKVTLIVTVFAVLILISLVISCFKIFPYLESKKKAGQTETAVKETVQDVPAAQQDNTELIAVIAAAIAASTGTSTDDFVVRSIKRRY